MKNKVACCLTIKRREAMGRKETTFCIMMQGIARNKMGMPPLKT